MDHRDEIEGRKDKHIYCKRVFVLCMYVIRAEEILKTKRIQGHIPWICKGGYLHSMISSDKVQREDWSTMAGKAGRYEIYEYNGRTQWENATEG